MDTGFIKPIQQPTWLANIVPVKKKMVKLFVVFLTLTKPARDEFPLPNIDSRLMPLVFILPFSFMGGFSGYDRIKMPLGNVEKTAFETPIGSWATYQQLVTTKFHDILNIMLLTL